MFNHIKTLGNQIKCKFNIDLPCQDDDDGVTTTTSQSGPVKTVDNLFGGPSSLGAANGAGSGIVFNKDSDDESEHGGGGNTVNVEELIRASYDSDGGEAIGIDW